ncbi:MAG: sporulation membrane protein YtaF [Limnochordales bacterium]|jgi:putative sporulation protein YtaF|nr:sporulation membrane protein YtaF [Bacillota bacterium]
MDAWSAAALACALSVDGLAVGAAFGLRRIRVPFWSLAIVGLCSAACFFAAAALGAAVAGAAGWRAPHRIGSVVLIVLGLWNIGKGWAENRAAAEARAPASGLAAGGAVRPLASVRIRSLGIVVHVLREPVRADVDRSGGIDAREAVLLGAALGLDALGAGFGAALIGVHPGAALLVAGAQMLMTWLGLRLGRAGASGRLGEKGFLVPGVILILLGLLQL